MKVHLKALGCRLNEAELEAWAHDFEVLGWRVTASAGEADLIVLNTCAVTAEATRKSGQAARRLARDCPTARLVLSGCQATLEPRQAATTLGVDLVVGNADKDRLVELCRSALDLPVFPAGDSRPLSLSARNRQRAFVKIQDGCRYRCSYCVVTLARGPERSRTVKDIVAEINTLRCNGVREVVLTGVHVGGYGSDLGASLVALVSSILVDTDIERVRFASVEPWDLQPRFFRLFDDPRLMPHLHLPLQSGSDRVLKRMSRRGDVAAYEALLFAARQQVPELRVSTDIIVGFPGETETDWRQTMDFVERMAFSDLHVFRYSTRAGTRAAAFAEQLPAALKKQRSEELQKLGLSMRRAYLSQCVGQHYPVLLEGAVAAAGGERNYGYTPGFVRVAVDSGSGAKLAGQIRDVRIVGVEGDIALGSLSGSANIVRMTAEAPRVTCV